MKLPYPQKDSSRHAESTKKKGIKSLESKQKKERRIKIIFINTSIALALIIFAILLAKTILREPDYAFFCGKPIYIEKGIQMTQEICESEGGEWINEKCHYPCICSTNYQESQKEYNLWKFIIYLITALLAIISGVIIYLETVSPGLIIGGSLLGLYAVIKYWEFFSDWLKTTVVGVLLIILILAGYRTIKK